MLAMSIKLAGNSTAHLAREMLTLRSFEWLAHDLQRRPFELGQFVKKQYAVVG